MKPLSLAFSTQVQGGLKNPAHKAPQSDLETQTPELINDINPCYRTASWPQPAAEFGCGFNSKRYA